MTDRVAAQRRSAGVSPAHFIVVEAYEGIAEFLSDEPGERAAAQALGLPIEEIAERLGCRFTVLGWDAWRRHEATGTSFMSWMPYPATRPIADGERGRDGGRDSASGARISGQHPRFPAAESRLKRVDVPARDPEHQRAFGDGDLSPRANGLLASGDPLLFASYCLDRELRHLQATDPFAAVILPMWGGLGYVAQMARATGAADALRVPIAVVVTDTSARRQNANEESMWAREAVARRQSEELSLALADLVLTFGPRGDGIASSGRLPSTSPAIRVPRAVAKDVIDRMGLSAIKPRTELASLEIFLREPQQAASGVLVALDAMALLSRRGIHFEHPVSCWGPEMCFAPMRPRGFVEYWSARGFVRELIRDRQWRWQGIRERSPASLPVRLYPSCFDHLPDIWGELQRGSAVLLSPAAAEGLAPDGAVPHELLVDGEPDAERMAAAMERILDLEPEQLEERRRDLCAAVLGWHRGGERDRLLSEAAVAIGRLAAAPPEPQPLGEIARLLVDRRRPLREIAAAGGPAAAAAGRAESGTLTVVVTCDEMGALLPETVESVWSAGRLPDELLVVDDGSQGAETRDAISELERRAAARRMPLRVIRQANHGLARARNRGLAAASGRFISFVDGGDLIEPGFYETALALLAREPGLGGVAAWSLTFGDAPEIFWNPPQTELPLLLVENTVFGPCVVSADVLRALGGFDARQRYAYEDWELSVRLLAAGHPIVTIPDYLHRYRMRDDTLLRAVALTPHDVMHERMLASHRETVARFGVEVAMLLEARPRASDDGRDASPVPHGGEAGRVHWLLARARSMRSALLDASGRIARRLHAP